MNRKSGEMRCISGKTHRKSGKTVCFSGKMDRKSGKTCHNYGKTNRFPGKTSHNSDKTNRFPGKVTLFLNCFSYSHYFIYKQFKIFEAASMIGDGSSNTILFV